MYVAAFTQAKLKVNEDVVLPINESAVMKQKLTEWISKAVVTMNETPSKTEKIIHCETTGVLDVWSSVMLI
jgi:hypothetical protein